MLRSVINVLLLAGLIGFQSGPSIAQEFEPGDREQIMLEMPSSQETSDDVVLEEFDRPGDEASEQRADLSAARQPEDGNSDESESSQDEGLLEVIVRRLPGDTERSPSAGGAGRDSRLTLGNLASGLSGEMADVDSADQGIGLPDGIGDLLGILP